MRRRFYLAALTVALMGIATVTPVLAVSDPFSGTTAPTTVNVRSGPGTSYGIVMTEPPSTTVNFNGYVYGEEVNDYWTGYPDPRWFFFYHNGRKAFIASAVVNGNPPRGNLRPPQRALNWAIGMQGNTGYYNLCEAFAENAYGTGGIYASADAAWHALGHSASLSSAPMGALIFFRADASNGYNGHVGLYVGNGNIVSGGLSTVQTTNIPGSSYWSGLYEGWGRAPSSWPGHSQPPTLPRSGATGSATVG